MAEFEVHADTNKNRVYVRIEGSLNIEEAEQLKEAYADAVDKCSPNFTVLNNVAELRPCISEVQEILKEITDIAHQSGVGKVARIVGETPIAGLQIDRISKSESHYHGESFKSIDEAEAYLDGENSD